MLGAIVGDIIGSTRENFPIKAKSFELFPRFAHYTDDTVLTVAVADAIMNGNQFGCTLKSYARRHPFRGYGPKFTLWFLKPGTTPYNSLGNGSAMRVSPVAYASGNEQEVLKLAKQSAECTHNHPEGIKGAQATALAIFLARQGCDKEEIRARIASRFGYNMNRSIDVIRPSYRTNLTCPGSVPEAIIAFLDSANFEDAIRNAISLGGDADTQAAIAGAIAEAYYNGVPDDLCEKAWHKLPRPFQGVIKRFSDRFELPTVLDSRW